MPRLDGIAFARELERRGVRAAIPIVVLSAGGRAGWARRPIGAEGCLAKPFELAALRRPSLLYWVQQPRRTAVASPRRSQPGRGLACCIGLGTERARSCRCRQV